MQIYGLFNQHTNYYCILFNQLNKVVFILLHLTIHRKRFTLSFAKIKFLPQIVHYLTFCPIEQYLFEYNTSLRFTILNTNVTIKTIFKVMA